jgi:hypothetical protein
MPTLKSLSNTYLHSSLLMRFSKALTVSSLDGTCPIHIKFLSIVTMLDEKYQLNIFFCIYFSPSCYLIYPRVKYFALCSDHKINLF